MGLSIAMSKGSVSLAMASDGLVDRMKPHSVAPAVCTHTHTHTHTHARTHTHAYKQVRRSMHARRSSAPREVGKRSAGTQRTLWHGVWRVVGEWGSVCMACGDGGNRGHTHHAHHMLRTQRGQQRGACLGGGGLGEALSEQVHLPRCGTSIEPPQAQNHHKHRTKPPRTGTHT